MVAQRFVSSATSSRAHPHTWVHLFYIANPFNGKLMCGLWCISANLKIYPSDSLLHVGHAHTTPH